MDIDPIVVALGMETVISCSVPTHAEGDGGLKDRLIELAPYSKMETKIPEPSKTKGERMNGKQKLLALAAGIAVALLSVVATYHFTGAPSDEIPCVAGQDEICPSPQWVKGAKKFQELNDSLNRGVPNGYHVQNGKFLKNPAPPAPPAPAPQPTAAPKK